MSGYVKPAIQVVPVSREAYRTLGRDALLGYIDDGRDWAFRGPRGGRYIASGPISWMVDEWGFYDMDAVRFIGRRHDVAYVRPTNSRAMARYEALAA